MTLRTPLGRVRGLGSAKSGTEHWWMQRVTAIANLPLVIFLVWFLASHATSSHAELVAAIASPFAALMLAAAIISTTWHMRLGMQVIIEDYVHGEGMKIALLLANTFFCAAVAFAGVFAVLKISFGG